MARNKGDKNLSVEERKSILQLHLGGASVKTISDTTGRSKAAILTVLKDAKLI